jgi:WhiB family redox-sensing transcriptional regulator
VTGLHLAVLPSPLAALLGPDLGGRAACAGRAPMFDAELPGETAEQREVRHHRAIDICSTCNVRAACTAARTDLGRDAAGIWAGVSSSGHHLTFIATRRTA